MESHILKTFDGGFYMPTMFHIYIGSDVNLKNWQSWDEESLSGFFHEYIHFFQDIMTATGLYNIFVNGEYISYACNYLYQQPTGNVKIPIPINPGANHVYDNSQVAKLTKVWEDKLPNGDDDPMHITSKLTSTPRVVQLWQRTLQIDEYTVTSHEGTFSVGAFQIIESMAYLAQKAIYGSSMPYFSPDYPYNVVEQIASYYVTPFPDQQQYHTLLFGLCHVSLMTSHPVKTLDELLKDAAARTTLVNDWRDILNDYFVNTTVIDLNGNVMPITRSIDSFKTLALTSLDKQFPTIDHQELQRWDHNAIEEMCTWWQANPMLLVDLLSFGPPRANPMFATLIERIGTPLLSNNRAQTYLYQPKGIKISKKHHARFLAAGSIIATFEDGCTMCYLHHLRICNKWLPCIRKSCQHTPWKRARLIAPCPYGHLWYGWKLRKYTPKK